MELAGGSRLQPASWSWNRTMAAIAAALVIHFGLLFAIPVMAEGLGYEPEFRDAGDIFEQAAAVVEYTDARLVAIATSAGMPEPPQLRGDVRTARVAYVAAIADLLLLAAVVVVAGGKGLRGLAREMGLDQSPLANISTPVIAAGVTIVAIAGYAALVRALNLDDLLVSDPAPATVLRDSAALTLFGVTTVVLAPVAEELLFRGLLMRKLLSLGAPVAIAGSAIVFAAWHVSPAVVPLVGVGAVLAWLYLRSATLWQPIIFHTIFNLVSFVQFAGHR